MAISNARAKQIQGFLSQKGVPVETVKGFGKKYPVADNENELGRNKNRRVEIWFKN
jgi:phosphate transport system substrate-binding protein